jgi:acyl carrier protein
MIRKIISLLSHQKTVTDREDDAAGDIDELSSAEQKIKAIMANVFGIGINDIHTESSADNIDQWNSIEHVNLLAALQDKFDIEFTDSQLVEMLSYKTIVENVAAAITEKNNPGVGGGVE